MCNNQKTCFLKIFDKYQGKHLKGDKSNQKSKFNKIATFKVTKQNECRNSISKNANESLIKIWLSPKIQCAT